MLILSRIDLIMNQFLKKRIFKNKKANLMLYQAQSGDE